MALADGALGAKPAEVKVADLKALFFVRDVAGDSHRQESQELTKPPVGRKIRMVFKDGEALMGSGLPAGSNNERCYVVTAATREIWLV